MKKIVISCIILLCFFNQVSAGSVDLTKKDPSLYRWGYWDKGVLPSAGPKTYRLIKHHIPRYRQLPIYKNISKNPNMPPHIVLPHIKPKQPHMPPIPSIRRCRKIPKI